MTDIEGFYCAIGEAINGPGGYFGWNLDALDDCPSGRFGARAPFRLVWHVSAVAREHLVAGYDRRRLAPAITLEYLLDILTAHHVKLDREPTPTTATSACPTRRRTRMNSNQADFRELVKWRPAVPIGVTQAAA